MPKLYRVGCVVLSLWLAAWIVISWPACQDDAFIHLRYADHLLHQHFVTYDGIEHTFGASSLLYIAVLAVLRAVFTSPELPRAVSTACHVLLFAGLMWGFAKRLQGAPRAAWGMALLLLACLVSPSAVRWLDDGMETSLVLCFMAVYVFALAALARRARVSNLERAAWIALGFFTVLLRVELLLLIAFVALMILWMRWRERGDAPLSALLTAAAPVVGAGLAALFIVAVMHSLLPDTAIAKGHGVDGWRGTWSGTVIVFKSSPVVGCAVLLLDAVSLAAVWSRFRRLTLPTLAANSLFPVMLGLALARAQFVQGIRYFIWAMVFAALWNVLELAGKAEPVTAEEPRWMRLAVPAFAVLLVVAFAVESPIFYEAFAKRRGILAEFRGQHLDQLSDLRLAAADIGYIGYFTGSPVCDEEGLVNGRGPAAMTAWQRGTRCAAQQPKMGFYAIYQMAPTLGKAPDRTKWSVCGVYDLGNLRDSQLHYLVAAPDVAERVCAAAGNKPFPIEQVWPAVTMEYPLQ